MMKIKKISKILGLCLILFFVLFLNKNFAFAADMQASGLTPDQLNIANTTLPRAPYAAPQIVRQWQAEGKNIVFIDVRESKEYKAGHIDGAINIPFREVEKKAKKYKKEEPPRYVFYCIFSTWRAPYAANVWKDLGFNNVYILQGGISAWNAGGQVIYASDPGTDPKIIGYDPTLPKYLRHVKTRKNVKPIELTLEELAKFDGKDGHPAYVAVDGLIYDLTESRLWRGGIHDPSKGKAFAGQDLTLVIDQSPHGRKILDNFDVIGTIKK